MHVYWERGVKTAGDCRIQSLSWMGRIPRCPRADEDWQLLCSNYYHDGWLGVASARGVVGVTHTHALDHEDPRHRRGETESGERSNFNLRGHRAEITLVSWNEPYQKLASCDASGIIFVWIQYEGRWSIELINDRNTPVVCFAWSHDGKMALIAYKDGFILVGSVSGQRFWSTFLRPSSSSSSSSCSRITCGTWSPDDRFVFVGNSDGDIVMMDMHNSRRCILRVHENITDLKWSCPKFRMYANNNSDDVEEERRRTLSGPSAFFQSKESSDNFLMAVLVGAKDVHLLRDPDDLEPLVIKTGLSECVMAWSNDGRLLAVAGVKVDESETKKLINMLHFYNVKGVLLQTLIIPAAAQTVVGAVTFGHSDRRLFVSTGNQIHVAWLSSSCSMPSLQHLARVRLYERLSEEAQIAQLPLPCLIKGALNSLFLPTIRSHVPEASSLAAFVTQPLPTSVRLYCTMVRHCSVSTTTESDLLNATYTLYLEHLGGFLPLLKGRRVSKLRPEFVIYDPSTSSTEHLLHEVKCLDRNLQDDQNLVDRRQDEGEALDLINVLPEEQTLAEVRSNLWGTQFQVLSHSSKRDRMPRVLAQVGYRASLLHLEPRQMRVEVVDVANDDLDDQDDDDEDDEDEDEDEEKQQWEAGTRDANGASAGQQQGVSMRRGLLRAVLEGEKERGSSSASSSSSSSSSASSSVVTSPKLMLKSPSVAPIAPLPTRLSFCVEANNTNNESAIVDHCEDQGVVKLRRKSIKKAHRHYSAGAGASMQISVSCDHHLSSKADKMDAKHIDEDKMSWGDDSVGRLRPRSSSFSHDLDVLRTHKTTSMRRLVLSKVAINHTNVPDKSIVEQRRRSIYGHQCSKSRKKSVDDHNKDMDMCENCEKLAAIGGCNVDKNVEDELVVAFVDDNDHLEDPGSKHDDKQRLIAHSDHLDVINQTDLASSNRRHFDSVRSLLERVREILLSNKRRRPQSQSPNRCQKNLEHNGDKEVSSLPPASLQNTPELPRRRHFSPLRALKNSPLLRRRRQASESREAAERPTEPDGQVSSNSSRKVINPGGNDPWSKEGTGAIAKTRKPRRNLEVERRKEQATEFSDLESFQRTRLRNKLERCKARSTPLATRTTKTSASTSPSSSPLMREPPAAPTHVPSAPSSTPLTLSPLIGRRLLVRLSPSLSSSRKIFSSAAHPVKSLDRRRRRKWLLTNKAPVWNDQSRVYQLDFGGRVTKESAKNFQIEHNNQQVMQFGRIECNAYTLDFQAPFCVLQAFGLALANVTQRLK